MPRDLDCRIRVQALTLYIGARFRRENVMEGRRKACSAAVPAASLGAGRPHPGEVTSRDRGYLPHWEAQGSTYFVTFRLADSLPKAVLEKIKKEKEKDARSLPKGEVCEKYVARIDEYLDNGAGACYFANPRIANMMLETIRHLDSKRYRMLAWCIMPNHVHLIFKPLEGWKLPGIIHSIKSFSAKEANRILGRTGGVWQREYYDHMIRDEKDFYRCAKYILDNPVRAGLEKWEWVGYNIEGEEGRRDAGATGIGKAGCV